MTTHRPPNLMEERLRAAAEKAAQAERGPTSPTPGPRRPTPMLRTAQFSPQLLITYGIAAVVATVLAVSLFGRPVPTPAPAGYATAGPTFAPPAGAGRPQVSTASAETPAPLPTGEAYLVPVNEPPAPAQAPPAPPAPAYVPQAAPEPAYSELIPIPTEPPDWRVPYVSGFDPTAAAQNYVEVRP